MEILTILFSWLPSPLNIIVLACFGIVGIYLLFKLIELIIQVIKVIILKG